MDSSDNGVYGVNNYTENLINKGFSIKTQNIIYTTIRLILLCRFGINLLSSRYQYYWVV